MPWCALSSAMTASLDTCGEGGVKKPSLYPDKEKKATRKLLHQKQQQQQDFITASPPVGTCCLAAARTNDIPLLGEAEFSQHTASNKSTMQTVHQADPFPASSSSMPSLHEEEPAFHHGKTPVVTAQPMSPAQGGIPMTTGFYTSPPPRLSNNGVDPATGSRDVEGGRLSSQPVPMLTNPVFVSNLSYDIQRSFRIKMLGAAAHDGDAADSPGPPRGRGGTQPTGQGGSGPS